MSEDFIQHNPVVGDGQSGMLAAMAEWAEAGFSCTYASVELVVAEGNFVLVGSYGTFLGDSVAYFDLYRLEEGYIVEHWDVIQAIPVAEEFANDNGKF